MSALGEIFHVTPEDRQYNQRGLLSPVQRARWQRQRRWRLLVLVLMAVLMLLVALVALFNGGVGFGLALLAVVALLGAIAIVLQRREPLFQSLERVKRVTGPAVLSKESSMVSDSRRISFQLTLSGVTFPVTRRDFRRLERERVYTGYFIPSVPMAFLPMDNVLVALETSDDAAKT